MIHGNTENVKKFILEELEKLYEIKMHRNEFASPALLHRLAELTGLLNREVSVYVTRGGTVRDVSLGDGQTVSLPCLRVRRGLESLAGVRCIHTHPEGSSGLSDVDRGTLVSARLDAMAALATAGGTPVAVSAAFIGEELGVRELGPYAADGLPQRALMAEIAAADARVKNLVALKKTRGRCEKAILVGVNAPEESMAELARLTDTAGAEAVKTVTQQRPMPDEKTYVGRGLAQQLLLDAAASGAELLIANDELNAATVKNIEELTGVRVVDRTALILDIFAKRAHTREGALQVELAQLRYRLPRLRGAPMSRLGGGIGTRGPGEKKLETDRRRILRRIFELEKALQKIEGQRALRRETRRESGIPVVALAGYTNAGKSTLLNALCGAQAFAEDKLFATLEPLTRRAALPSGREALFSDTVGFIEKLPHDLVSAFCSTLEEVKYADLILHVIDLSNPAHARQESVAEAVLESLGAGGKRILRVYNKADLADGRPENNGAAMFVSAKTGQGMNALVKRVDEMLMPLLIAFERVVPYGRGDVLHYIRAHAQQLCTDYAQGGVDVSGQAEPQHIRRMDELLFSRTTGVRIIEKSKKE